MPEGIANVTISEEDGVCRVLVPVEPTKNMMDVGVAGALTIALGGSAEEGLREIWAAMVEAGRTSGEILKTSHQLHKSVLPRSPTQ